MIAWRHFNPWKLAVSCVTDLKIVAFHNCSYKTMSGVIALALWLTVIKRNSQMKLINTCLVRLSLRTLPSISYTLFFYKYT